MSEKDCKNSKIKNRRSPINEYRRSRKIRTNRSIKRPESFSDPNSYGLATAPELVGSGGIGLDQIVYAEPE